MLEINVVISWHLLTCVHMYTCAYMYKYVGASVCKVG